MLLSLLLAQHVLGECPAATRSISTHTCLTHLNTTGTGSRWPIFCIIDFFFHLAYIQQQWFAFMVPCLVVLKTTHNGRDPVSFQNADSQALLLEMLGLRSPMSKNPLCDSGNQLAWECLPEACYFQPLSPSKSGPEAIKKSGLNEVALEPQSTCFPLNLWLHPKPLPSLPPWGTLFANHCLSLDDSRFNYHL